MVMVSTSMQDADGGSGALGVAVMQPLRHPTTSNKEAPPAACSGLLRAHRLRRPAGEEDGKEGGLMMLMLRITFFSLSRLLAW